MFKKIAIITSIIISIILIYMFYNNNIMNDIYVTYKNKNENYITEKVDLTEQEIINKYKDYDYLKIDKINELKEINLEQLEELIKESNENSFSYGFSLLNGKIILLCEEINTYKVIDYDENSINFDNLNLLLESKNIKERITEISKIEIFKTVSSFYYNEELIDLQLANGFNIRNIEYQKDNLENIIINSSNLLASMNKENGKYVYGYRTNTGKIVNSYNILRHAGSTWSLILYYEKYPSKELKEIIDRAIDYLIDNYTINKDKNITYVVEQKSKEIKLGGNALTLLMLSDYYNVFNDDKYNDTAKKIANGIIKMQLEDGSYNHVLNIDFSLKEKYRTVYYDGESTFALLKFYGITKEKKYYKAALKTIDMFIEKKYEKYRDHWISYSINEFLKYNQEEKYIKFAFKNYTYNINRINDNETFGPIRLELLLSTYKTYNYIAKEKPESNSFKRFDIEKLEQSINYNLEILFNYYINEETAIYFKNQDISLFGFHDIDSNFRMRIDDIQHSILGIMMYYDEFIQKK